MSLINVFREGSSWRYSVDNVISPERCETRDDAQFAGEQAAVKLMKERKQKEQQKRKEEKSKKENTVE